MKHRGIVFSFILILSCATSSFAQLKPDSPIYNASYDSLIQMGQKGRERLLQKYSFEHFIKQHEILYRKGF